MNATTDRVNKILNDAVDLAKLNGLNYLGTEHLLYAMIIQDDGVAVETLNELGVDQTTVERELLRRFGE